MDRTLDNEQLNRLQDGDRAACEELVHAHYERIYRFLLHQTLDSHLAADLTQETFAAAWTGLKEFRGQSSVSTWLHQIAYRKHIDEARKHKRRQQTQQELRDNWIQQCRRCASLQKIVEDEQSRRLYDALQQLDDRERDVLVLRYLQGMTVRETADVMNDPPGTTKWRTSRALGRLRVLLSKDVLNDVQR